MKSSLLIFIILIFYLTSVTFGQQAIIAPYSDNFIAFDRAGNPNNSERFLTVLETEFYTSFPKADHGDTIKVVHTEGIGDGNIIVTVLDQTKLTGDDYEVYFKTQQQIRDENGDWVPGSVILRNFNSDDPDTLTGTTIDVAAVHGSTAGTTELRFHLDVVHHYYGWVDGVILTFPANVTIISSPPFEAGGGMVTPEIIGQEIHYGITDNSGTGNGIFHGGGEDWIVIVSTITPPMVVDWIAFDDGYAGGGPPLPGTTTVTGVGFASRLAYLWNLFDVTTGELTLEDISIVNGIDLFPPRDDAPTMVPNPIADGLQINADISYDEPVTIGSLELNGDPIESNSNPPYGIQDYTVFGVVPPTAANSSLGVGTDQLELLQKDYELIYTGTRELISIGGINVEITSEGGGSIATLYGARDYDIAIHPLNPNPGSSDPFTVRIPFEVWSIDDSTQINLMVYDRRGDPKSDDPFRVWNTEDRIYTAFVLTEYQETPYSLNDPELVEFATWNLVWWVNHYNTGDVINVYYDNPIIPGEDRFAFTAPDMVVSVEDESLPLSFELFQNYPNPFNPITKITYTIPQLSFVTLNVYDVLGNEIVTLVNKEKTAGNYEVEFSSKGEASDLTSGVYFYQLSVRTSTGSVRQYVETKKMVLLK